MKLEFYQKIAESIVELLKISNWNIYIFFNY